MTSISQLGANDRSMNGLNNFTANSISTGDIIVDTIEINTSGTTPLVVPLTASNNNIANTAFVQGAILTAAANYMDLTTNQTVATGVKTFTSLPESSAVPSTGNQLVNKTFTDATYVDFVNNETIGGIKTFTSLPQSSAVPTLGDELVNKTFTDATYVDFVNNETIGGVKTFTNGVNTTSIETPLAADNLTIASNQSSGTCNIATLNTRGGAINIGTGNTAKALSVGGTGTTTTMNSLTTTINTSTITGIGITHSSAATTADNMRLTATGGYIARLGEGSATNGLTLLGIDTGTCIIRGRGTALQLRGDNGITMTGTTTISNGALTNSIQGIAITSTINLFTNTTIGDINIATGALSGTISIATNTTGGVNIGSSSSVNTILGDTNINTTGSLGTTIGNGNGLLRVIGPINIIPAGTIIMGLYTTAPEGYVKCDGTSYATASIYAPLFAVISYNYGGSGANFNVPDFRAAFLRGTGTQTVGITYTGGALSSAGRQQDAVLTPLYASNEGFRSCAAGARDCVARDIITTDPTDTNTGILPRFDRTATENRPFNYSVNYWIKYS